MGLSSIQSKLIAFIALVLLPFLSTAQQTVFTIPGVLKINNVANTVTSGDSMLVIGTDKKVKKRLIPLPDTTAGIVSTGSNGLSGDTIITLGGTLTKNTTINDNGFNFIINQTSFGPFIQQWQFSGSNVAGMDGAGNLNLNGIRYLANGNTGRIDFTGGSTTVIRNVADNGTGFKVALLNTAATGDIAIFENYAYSTLTVGQGITQHPFTKVGYNMLGSLTPSVNGDTLMGVYIHPLMGVSTINTTNSLLPGSGYPNGTFLSNVSGGTGRQAVFRVVVSGGAVQSATKISGGVNYTVGDVLNIVITDVSGNPVGSGSSITVQSIISYTGINKWALVTGGLDQYDQDYSGTYTLESKTSKRYVDNRAISNSYSNTASAQSTYTVPIGSTQPNNTYKVQITATSTLAETPHHVTNKTTTTFDVVYDTPLTGSVTFDFSVLK